jgi:hypothetical protein
MRTDWDLVRTMMNAAIDACEQMEKLGIGEADRDARADVAGRTVSVFDTLVSSWTYPERVRYQIIRERHEKGADLPHVPDAARLLVSMAQACGELVGARDSAPADAACRAMARWYGDHALPTIARALENPRKASD